MDPEDVIEGDLVFYGANPGRPTHVAFWAGNGRILHATPFHQKAAVYVELEGGLAAERLGFYRYSWY